MATLTLRDVHKRYDDGFHAVRGVSLDIGADGSEFVVLVGPSGCGKSTTLRMIAGLEGVSAGSIAIDGRVINDVHPKDRDIAMVFQNYALYPHMTVRENIGFSLRLRGVPRAERDARVRDAAAMLGLEAQLDRKPAALSGGQRQRVAVGRAIVRQPKVFLFDEPLSNLDARLRVTTRAEIKALQLRLGVTTVYVTHDQEEAMTLGDRVVVMLGGLVQQAGSPMEIYERPANRFVAAFLGTPPMNFIEGVVRDGPARLFEGAGLRLTLPASLAPACARAAGRAGVALGVRPPSLRLARPEHEPHASTLTGRVELVEPLGDVADVRVRLAAGASPSPAPGAAAAADFAAGGVIITARLPARDALNPAGPLRVGDAVRLTLDDAGVHLFEPGETGVAIT